MATAVGLVLSTIALYTLAIDSVKFVSNFVDFPPDARYLKVRFDLEIADLTAWCEETGLANGVVPQYLNEETIRAVFTEIHAITASTKLLKERYQLELSVGSGPQLYPINYLDALVPFSDPAMVASREAELQDLSKKVRLGRLRWVAWDKGKFDVLIAKLHEINSTLNHLIAGPRSESLREKIKSLQAQIVTLEHNITELKTLQKAASTYNPNMSASLQLKLARLLLDEEFQQRVSRFSMPVPGTNMLLEKRLLDIAPSTGSPTFVSATYHGQQVVVEWKPYGTSWGQDMDANQRTERVRALASLLAEAKPKELRTLHCIGYLDDPQSSKFSLVFLKPLTVPRDIEPHNFLYLISNSLPSLTERLRLARHLANSLFELLIVGWYHKSLRPQNILFFPSSADQNALPIPEPYLIGFEYSRPNLTHYTTTEGEPVNPEFDIYRHPHQLVPGEPFHQDFDIYSFGLLLVVIALWKKIEDIAKIFKITVLTPRELWDRVLDPNTKHRKRLIRDVAFRMGDVYAGVVDKCLALKTSFGSTGVGDIRSPFFEQVLKPLEQPIM